MRWSIVLKQIKIIKLTNESWILNVNLSPTKTIGHPSPAPYHLSIRCWYFWDGVRASCRGSEICQNFEIQGSPEQGQKKIAACAESRFFPLFATNFMYSLMYSLLKVAVSRFLGKIIAIFFCPCSRSVKHQICKKIGTYIRLHRTLGNNSILGSSRKTTINFFYFTHEIIFF